MILCHLCGQAKECTPRQIEGKEYDVCADCWNPLAEKLKSQGRVKEQREMVFLPPLTREPEPPATRPNTTWRTAQDVWRFCKAAIGLQKGINAPTAVDPNCDTGMLHRSVEINDFSFLHTAPGESPSQATLSMWR